MFCTLAIPLKVLKTMGNGSGGGLSFLVLRLPGKQNVCLLLLAYLLQDSFGLLLYVHTIRNVTVPISPVKILIAQPCATPGYVLWGRRVSAGGRRKEWSSVAIIAHLRAMLSIKQHTEPLYSLVTCFKQ